MSDVTVYLNIDAGPYYGQLCHAQARVQAFCYLMFIVERAMTGDVLSAYEGYLATAATPWAVVVS